MGAEQGGWSALFKKVPMPPMPAARHSAHQHTSTPAHQHTSAAESKRQAGLTRALCNLGLLVAAAAEVSRVAVAVGVDSWHRLRLGLGRRLCRGNEAGQAIEPTIQLQWPSAHTCSSGRRARQGGRHAGSSSSSSSSSRRTWGGWQLRALLGAPHALGIELPALQVGVHHKLHLITRLQDVLPSHLRYRNVQQQQQ